MVNDLRMFAERDIRVFDEVPTKFKGLYSKPDHKESKENYQQNGVCRQDKHRMVIHREMHLKMKLKDDTIENFG